MIPRPKRILAHSYTGTWLVLHKAQFPHEPQPSLSSLTQRFDVADLHSAARLGDVVLVQRLFARAAMVGL